MPTRHLGPSGLKIPIFSLGGWLTYGGTQKGSIVKDIMKAAFDNGINFFGASKQSRNAQGCSLTDGQILPRLTLPATVKLKWVKH